MIFTDDERPTYPDSWPDLEWKTNRRTIDRRDVECTDRDPGGWGRRTSTEELVEQVG
jgi:hypothetical protein